MKSPEMHEHRIAGTTELMTLLDAAVQMTVKTCETLGGEDIETMEELMKARGIVIEKAAVLCDQKPWICEQRAGQEEGTALLQMAVAVLQKSDEELRSLLLKKKAAVLDQIQFMEKQKQINRYIHAGEIPEALERRTHT